MKTLINDAEVSTVETSPEDIDVLLSGYNKPAEVKAETQEQPTEEKRGRGRPPGSTNKKTTETNEEQPKEEPKSVGGSLISGALFLTLIDVLIPLIIGLINDRMHPKEKLDINRLKLTPKQHEELKPMCNEVVKQLQITSNPVVLLIVSLIGIYGMNYVSLRQAMKYEKINK